MPTPNGWNESTASTLSGNDDTDALLGGTQWATARLTWSTPGTDARWSVDEFTGYGPRDGNGAPWSPDYGPLDAAQGAAVTDALQAWAAVSALVFVRVEDTATRVGDLRFAFTGSPDLDGVAAFAFLPEAAAFAGDVWFNRAGSSGTEAWTPGSYAYMSALHEIGHALGLKHPFEIVDANWTTLEGALDSRSWTLMSYAAQPNVMGTWFNFEPTTPMLLDIAAVQHLYGANTTRAAGDTTYTYREGTLYHQTLWDTGGIDTIVLDSATGGSIDLRGGFNGSRVGAPVWTEDSYGQRGPDVDNLWIAFGTDIENAVGGNGGDRLTGNALDNLLRGRGGSDTLAGSPGHDTLEGGAGADWADFSASPAGVVASLAAASAQRTGEAAASVLASLENLRGSAYADDLQGDAGANALQGGAGDDTLEGGPGADTLDGGLGEDIVSFAGSSRGIVIDLSRSVPQDTGLGRDLVLGMAGVIGSQWNDRIRGDSEAERLDGGAGADTLYGGGGGDVFCIDSVDDVLGGADYTVTDTVVSAAAAHTLGPDFDDLVIVAGGAADGTGNAAPNRILAGPGDNVMDGAGGRDTLSYANADAGVHVDLGRGDAQPTGGSGMDTVLDFEQLEGSSFGDTLVGGAAGEGLEGGAGDDVLAGGGGADTLSGGSGLDVARFDAPLAALRFGLDGGGLLTVGLASGAGGQDVLTGIESLETADARIDGLEPAGGFVDPADDYFDSHDESIPHVAALEGGGNVVAWQAVGQGGGEEHRVVQVRVMDAQGVAGELLTIEAGARECVMPLVAALADGGFVLAWRSKGADGLFHQWTRSFDADGVARSTAAAAGDQGGFTSSGSALVGLADGSYVLAWEEIPAGISHACILARRFGADGSALGEAFQLNAREFDAATTPALAALAGGGFVAAWRSHDDSLGDGIYLRSFAADGSAGAVESRASLAQGESQSAPALAALEGGGFVLAWQTDGWGDAGQFEHVVFREFDAAGGAVSRAREVDAGGTGLQSEPTVTATAGGGFAIGWTERQGYAQSVLLRSFDDSGKPAGDAGVADAEHVYAGSPSLAALPDGELLLVWARGGGGSAPGVLEQRFDADGSARLPRIVGGVGDDHIDIAGAGALEAAGGPGDDSYVVDVAGDRVRELADEGRDTVLSACDWTLPDAVEVLVLAAGSPALAGTGNRLANLIDGNAADNLLRGLAGADRLNGADGADTLRGGGAGDRLDGSAGADLLAGDKGDDRLAGGPGRDTLEGGAGVDAFVFDTELARSGPDLVADFVAGTDRVLLDAGVFGALEAGRAPTAGQFIAGEGLVAAQTAGQRLVYDSADGILYYDADGVDGVAPVAIARFGANVHPLLGAGDFLVIATG